MDFGWPNAEIGQKIANCYFQLCMHMYSMCVCACMMCVCMNTLYSAAHRHICTCTQAHDVHIHNLFAVHAFSMRESLTTCNNSTLSKNG